jgi:hypothetical protein
MPKNQLTDLEIPSGVRVTSFFVSVTFFPESIKNGQSNNLFLKTVSAMSDNLSENDSLVRWSVQSIRDNFYNNDTEK